MPVLAFILAGEASGRLAAQLMVAAKRCFGH